MAGKRSLGSLIVQVGADTRELNAGLKSATQSTKDFGSSAAISGRRARDAFSGAGGGFSRMAAMMSGSRVANAFAGLPSMFGMGAAAGAGRAAGAAGAAGAGAAGAAGAASVAGVAAVAAAPFVAAAAITRSSAKDAAQYSPAVKNIHQRFELRKMTQSMEIGRRAPGLMHAIAHPGDYAGLAKRSLMLGGMRKFQTATTLGAALPGPLSGLAMIPVFKEALYEFFDKLPTQDANASRANPFDWWR